jgi:hypothetical protein
MIASRWQLSCPFLDGHPEVCTLAIFMRKTLKIRVAFEPTRLGHEHLKRAYELVLPVQRRTLTRPNDPKSEQEQPYVAGKPQVARSKP